VISSDDDDGIFGDDAGLTGDGDGDGDGDPMVGDGDPEVDGSVPGDGDPMVDAGDGDPMVDGGDEPMCFAPDQSEPCGACVADNCLAEWCACDADESCGLPGDEFFCINSCTIELSGMGETAEDAFMICAEGCAISEDFLLADTTLNLLSCLRAGVPDPTLADAGIDAGGFEVAVCGYSCFGYEEPGE
jgi:hypothetical protein